MKRMKEILIPVFLVAGPWALTALIVFAIHSGYIVQTLAVVFVLFCLFHPFRRPDVGSDGWDGFGD